MGSGGRPDGNVGRRMSVCSCYWDSSDPHVRENAGCMKRGTPRSPHPLCTLTVSTVARIVTTLGFGTGNGSANRFGLPHKIVRS